MSSCKFLVVYLDANLSWSKYIDLIFKQLFFKRKIRYKLHRPSYLLLILYKTMVLPYLEYCNIVWTSNYPTLLDRLIKLQKKIIRLSSGSYGNEHSSPLFKNVCILKILNLWYKFTTDLNIHVQNYIITYSLPNLHCISPLTACNIHTYNTRSQEKYMPSVTKNIRKFIIKNYGPQIYNNMPSRNLLNL